MQTPTYLLIGQVHRFLSFLVHTDPFVGLPLPDRPGFVQEHELLKVIFGDFGVSFAATVAGRYTRRGGPRLSVQGEPLIVLTRGP